MDRLSIFLCHSRGDKPAVRELCRRLKSAGFDPWLDEENLVAGQDWQKAIQEAVRNSDIVLVCLSRDSVSKKGFVQKEIKEALDVADEFPEGTVFIVPLRLEECAVPERLRRWHWIDYFEERGEESLLAALAMRLNQINSPVSQVQASSVLLNVVAEAYATRLIAASQEVARKNQLTSPVSVALVGRTGVGKSSLIYAWMGGHTRAEDALITPAGIIGSYRWNQDMVLLNIPGMSDPESGGQAELEEWIHEKCDLILFIVDISFRRAETELRQLARLKMSSTPVLLVATRADTIPAYELRRRLEHLEQDVGMVPIPVSAYEDSGVDKLRETVSLLIEMGKDANRDNV